MSNRVRICLIGTGRAGQVHANSLCQRIPAGELVALVDSVSDVLHKVGEQWGVKDSAAVGPV
jgi:predicted dehydrogenase